MHNILTQEKIIIILMILQSLKGYKTQTTAISSLSRNVSRACDKTHSQPEAKERVDEPA